MSDATPPRVPPTEHHLATVRTGRYFTVGAELRHTRRVWFVLHGYAQLAARTLRHFADIVPADTLIVAPEGLSRFYLELPRADGGHMARVGATWMTREDREAEIDDTRGWLDRVYREIMDGVIRESGAAPAVTVLAFSQGVATGMRWIANGVVRPSRAIMWAGGVAADVSAESFRAEMGSGEVILVSGSRDQFFATEDKRERMRSDWSALGIAPREITYDGTHELNAAVLAELLLLNPP